MRTEKTLLGESHFDENARRWDENPVFQERGRKIAAGIRAEVALHEGMHALDYGCGTGLLSFPMKDQLGQITLADTSTGMLGVLQEKIAGHGVTHMTPLRLDLLSDPLPPQRFDLIYTAMTLHHIPDTDRILGIFHELLAPGGHLCIADLDQEDGSFHGHHIDVHHGFDRDELAGKARRDGFQAIRFQTVFEIVKDLPEGRRAYPVFLMVAQRGAG